MDAPSESKLSLLSDNDAKKSISQIKGGVDSESDDYSSIDSDGFEFRLGDFIGKGTTGKIYRALD